MIKALAGGLCLRRDITCSGNDSYALSLIISLNKYLANITCDYHVLCDKRIAGSN